MRENDRPRSRALATGGLLVLLAGAGTCRRGLPATTIGLLGAASAPASQPWFNETAERDGLRFIYTSGYDGKKHWMPEGVAGGCALFDMDNDGDLDAYLLQSGSIIAPPASRPGNQLLRNRGDGTFDNVTAGSGTEDRGYAMGVACGDYDNDGDVDLYVTNLGPNLLLRNEGGGLFTDVTAEARVGHAAWGASTAFFDYDRDGNLDLYVTNYIHWSPETEMDCYSPTGLPEYCSPKNYAAPAQDVLYHNNGDGTFTDVSAAAGLTSAFGNGLGVVTGDFDANGYVDVFVADDASMNQLWLNAGDGTFADESLFWGCAVDQDGLTKAGMGVTAADLDDDGLLDILVVNQRTESDSVFINKGRFFVDGTATSGLGPASRTQTRFGVGLVDFDNDGLLDLYEANGRVAKEFPRYGTDPYAEPNLLCRGVGGGAFQEVLPRGGTRELLISTSRGAAFGDVDNDGGVDILVVNREAAPYLLRNVAARRGNWIMFRVLDEHGRDALNARVTVVAGDRRLRREVRAAYSYCSSNDPRVHVGLGACAAVEDVVVTWIDGTTQAFGAFAANQIVTLRRSAPPASAPPP